MVRSVFWSLSLFLALACSSMAAGWQVASPSGNVLETTGGLGRISLLTNANLSDVIYSVWIEGGRGAVRIAEGRVSCKPGDGETVAIDFPVENLTSPMAAVLRIESGDQNVVWRFRILPEAWVAKSLSEMLSGAVKAVGDSGDGGWDDLFAHLGVDVEGVSGMSPLAPGDWIIVPEGWQPSGQPQPNALVLVQTDDPSDFPVVISQSAQQVKVSAPAARIAGALKSKEQLFELILALQSAHFMAQRLSSVTLPPTNP